MKHIAFLFLFIGCIHYTCKSQAVFINFQAQTHNDTIEVSWITQSEFNIDYFVLQRAYVGNAVFSDLASINAVGNSSTNQYYTYNDIPPLVDTCYLYQIRAVQMNGQFAYYTTVVGCVFTPNSVNEIGSEITTTIYPNPSSGTFVLKCSEIINKGTMQVLNTLGENIFTREILNESEFEVNLKNISPGIYFLNMNDGVRRYCKKITIENE